MAKKNTLTLLVDVPTVYTHTYKVEVDVADILPEDRALHRGNPWLKERAVAAARKALEHGTRELGGVACSHVLEPHTWVLRNVK